ncbi:RES family NAD+ phosphorylase (plasmid) [Stutzerimonas frequens]|uniref:RES family NAD+ phosphorylase n=1 Tax=Stutzerimonas frequens TaxID=2968969 RepID=UPI002DB8EC94|nr:RES family NAD+ phosphorylase [Stutzerimonas frequens]WRW29366.1 RES family NAD+ phosphorylase [Stutzerimonas frequens]
MSDQNHSRFKLWRISPFADLSGRGGVIASGRWHSAGRPVVYLAETPAGAMLETLVHLELDPEDVPDTYQLLRVELPEEASLVIAGHLEEGWEEDHAITQTVGNQWLEEGESLLLQVPSAIMPHTRNYLMNPTHHEAGEVEFEAERWQFDKRLLK